LKVMEEDTEPDDIVRQIKESNATFCAKP